MRGAFAVALLAVGCARTGLLDFGRDDGDDEPQPDECTTASDCPLDDFCAPPECVLEGSGESARRRCVVTPVTCDDGDPCTLDACDSTTGVCVFTPPFDRDGDGHLAEAPFGAPASCGGLDCDDEDASIFPGAPERCDSRDQDCDGAVDEGFSFESVSLAPVPLLPPERGSARHGGLDFDGSSFGVSYHTSSEKTAYFKLIAPNGQDVTPETRVSHINAESFSGPVVWSGEAFLTAFRDARQGGNYEIYTTRFGASGQKLEADRRLSDARDHSLNPAVLWTGEEFVVVWDDRRARSQGGVSQIFARRLSRRGEPESEENLLSAPATWSEKVALALGTSSIGMAYLTLRDGIPFASFRSFDRSLASGTPALELPSSADANTPAIAFAAGRYFVVWATARENHGNVLWALTLDEAGNVLSGPSVVTAGFSFTRNPSLVSLGDRVLLVFSGVAARDSYELYASTLDGSLAAPAASTRLTHTAPHSVAPLAVLGPAGTIGIVFDEEDDRPPASQRPHFMAVGCPLVER